METYDIIAKTLFGLEEVLAKEIEQLGGTDIELLNRAVIYRGDDELLYKSNLLLRTALKILKPIAFFQAENETELYKKINNIAWEKFLDVEQTLAVDATTKSSIFTHSKYVALKTKDAIVDRFRDKYGKRPSVDTVNPNLSINIHIFEKACTVSLDSSGTSLDKRGYRLERTLAPINEVLAAGMILMSGWHGECDFYDPMCGSGTFSIEAALIAANIPSGNLRNFAFERWNNFDENLWKKIKEEANALIVEPTCNILASDINKAALDVLRNNAERAAVDEYVVCSRRNFFATTSQSEKGIIFLNPPYGERLEEEDIYVFYREIGSRCKQYYVGCDAWVISSNFKAIQNFGLTASYKTLLFNGALECKLHKYELYEGSRRSAE